MVSTYSVVVREVQTNILRELRVFDNLLDALDDFTYYLATFGSRRVVFEAYDASIQLLS
jgi:tRNA C32,U32 (ribose-2'-O)-methylase TrmJ